MSDDNTHTDWKYFATTVDTPSHDEYRIARAEAFVVMKVSPDGTIEYRLQLPEWKIKQEVVRMVEDFEYMRTKE